MAWLIQRTAPGDPVAFWGKNDRWIHRPRIKTTGEILKPRIPDLAARYEDYDAAFDIAEYLRANQPLAHGEVIAVIPNPEPVPA